MSDKDIDILTPLQALEIEEYLKSLQQKTKTIQPKDNDNK